MKKEYAWMNPGTDWMTEEIKHYWFKERAFSNGTIATNEQIAESPELYDMEDATEVKHAAIAADYETDIFTTETGRVLVADMCGIVQYIADNMEDAINWVGMDVLPMQ